MVEERKVDQTHIIEGPLVSIVIPAYNHARYLGRAIESVLFQDYPKIELIVINDGSTDNTAEVLAQYNGSFSCITQVNAGQANTLSRGWRLASGEILSYLSADDELLPNAVSSSIEHFEEGVVLTYCDFNLLDPSSKVIRTVRTEEFDYRRMFAELVCFPGPGAFFTRQAFEFTGGWNSAYRQMPDFEYWLRLGLQGRFVRVPEVLAGFRVHEDSQTFAVADEAKANEPVEVMKNFMSMHQLPASLGKLRDVALSNALILSGQLHLKAGRFTLALRAFIGAYKTRRASIFTVRMLRVMANSLFSRTFHRFVRLKNKLLT